MYVSICFEFDKFIFFEFDKFCLYNVKKKKSGEKKEVMSSTSNVYMN